MSVCLYVCMYLCLYVSMYLCLSLCEWFLLRNSWPSAYQCLHYTLYELMPKMPIVTQIARGIYVVNTQTTLSADFFQFMLMYLTQFSFVKHCSPAFFGTYQNKNPFWSLPCVYLCLYFHQNRCIISTLCLKYYDLWNSFELCFCENIYLMIFDSNSNKWAKWTSSTLEDEFCESTPTPPPLKKCPPPLKIVLIKCQERLLEKYGNVYIYNTTICLLASQKVKFD